MAITFPANPNLNDTFTSGGKTFQWNGTSWTVNQEANILADTTPQLGGNLDLNSQDITGTGDINVTGTVTATSFSGDGSSLTGAGTTTTAEWTLGSNGSDYTFTGPGVTAGATDPTIYLTRGQTYKFKNRSGGHPFRIQTSFQNTGGTAYTDGITISDGSTASSGAGNNADLYWEVRNDTPDTLYYQCTAHTNMSGRINMISGENKSIGLGTTDAAGRDAGISTATGTVIYDPDIGMQVYSGDAQGWRTIANTESIKYLQATGGSVSNYVDGSTRYAVHTFNSTQTFEITQLAVGSAPSNIDYLVIAGGGGGGSRHGGGGGAGGMLTGSYTASALETRTMTVGGGGNGAPPAGDSSGSNGVASSISGGIASAVGGGAGTSGSGPGGPGGSGGGSRGNGPSTVPGGSGTGGQGNAGGSGDSSPSGYSLGGGGGGAGGTGNPGGPGGSNLGQGGPGGSSTIEGSSNTYAGGGGGGGNGTFASGGPGGGGNAGPSGTPGSANTGGGGGAGGHNGGTNYAGYAGGPGVIIVRYVTDPA